MALDQESGNLDERFSAFIPAGDRAAFKNALYNCILFVFLAIAVSGVWAVYHLLFMFLTPMMWAMLLGTLLFPLKRIVAVNIRSYLRSLREGGTPLAVGLVCMPFSLFDTVGMYLCNILFSKNMLYVAGSYISLHILTYKNSFAALINLVARIHGYFHIILSLFAGKWILPILSIYICAYGAWLYLQPADVNKKLARILGLPIWIVVLAYVSQWFCVLNVIVFVTSVATIACIAAGVIEPPGQNTIDPNEDSNEERDSYGKGESELKAIDATASIGDVYLKLVLAACVLLYMVRHPILLTILLIPLLCTLVKKAAQKSGIVDKCKEFVEGEEGSFSHRVQRCVDVAVPGTVRHFGKIVFTSDQWLTEMLEHSMDTVSSCVVILFMLLTVILGSGFIIFQVHGEVVGLVKLSASLLNSEKGLPSWLAGAANYTGEQMNEHDIENYVEQGFMQARTWAATKVRSLADPSDSERADMLEANIKQLVDKVFELYQSWWTSSSTASPSTTSSEDILTHLTRTTDLTQLKNEFLLIVQENITAIISLAESIWGVLMTNATLLLSLLAGLGGIILGFGLELVNLIVEVVVFFSVLFQLLMHSKRQWKPLEWFAMLTPDSRDDNGGGITHAFEQAIQGVFILSIKMCLFYGMYIWFVHALFDLNIIFVPSVLAALFAAVPLTSPYMVCLPGVLELIAKNETPSAIVFFIISFAPVMFVDTAFYMQVKGTHPYLTGLAIVGGMYWLGLQGALIGPIILCCVLVLFNMCAGRNEK